MLFSTRNHLALGLRFFRTFDVQHITRSKITWLLLFVMSLSTATCSPALVSTSTPHVTDSPALAFTSTPHIVATYMTALLIGKLVNVDGCLRVNTDSDTSYLLAWPPDFEVSRENDEIQITKQDGEKVVLRVGEMIRLSGGEVKSARFLDERVRQELPSHCPGPYWVVGIEVAPVTGDNEP